MHCHVIPISMGFMLYNGSTLTIGEPMRDMLHDLTGINSKDIFGSGNQAYICKATIDTAEEDVEIVDSHDGWLIRVTRWLFSFIP